MVDPDVVAPVVVMEVVAVVEPVVVRDVVAVVVAVVVSEVVAVVVSVVDAVVVQTHGGHPAGGGMLAHSPKTPWCLSTLFCFAADTHPSCSQ